MRRFYYSLAYLILLGIPAAILGYTVRSTINFSALILLIFVSLIVGGIFDIWAVRQGKRDNFFIWEYNSKSIIGFKIYGVPVEDFVFFLFFTPCFIVVVYEGIRLLLGGTDLGMLVVMAMIILTVSYSFVYKHAIRSKK